MLGTSPVNIDRAENRDKFSAMLDKLGIDQPAWRALTSFDDIKEFVSEVGYPVLVRPSYVLSGAAMNVCYDDEELHRFLSMATEVSKEFPVVVSKFMTETKEIEFDAVADKGEVVEYAISEHVEYAGVHSGDATMVFPAQHIYFSTVRQIKKISRKIAKELNISGPFNIQFLAKNREVKVIECKKRNFIETATKIMLDAPYSRPEKFEFDIDRIGVKASQFSFARLQNADPVLGVDMSSTGEVGCLGDDLNEALLNALIATGYRLPKQGASILISSGAAKGKVSLLGQPAGTRQGTGTEGLQGLRHRRYGQVLQRQRRGSNSRLLARRGRRQQRHGHDCPAPVRPHRQRAQEPHQARADQRLPHPPRSH